MSCSFGRFTKQDLISLNLPTPRIPWWFVCEPSPIKINETDLLSFLLRTESPFGSFSMILDTYKYLETGESERHIVVVLR